MIVKTNPNIDYTQFLSLIKNLKEFTSVTGNVYTVVSLNVSLLTFIRESSGVEWSMNLNKLYQAYMELTEFKTNNFKPYLPRRQSPALGLLLSSKLLIK